MRPPFPETIDARDVRGIRFEPSPCSRGLIRSGRRQIASVGIAEGQAVVAQARAGVSPDNLVNPPRAAEAELSPDDVRARIDWARSQGNPAWLWPDVAIADWSGALEKIARAASGVLRSDAEPGRLEGHAEALDIAAYTSGMGPLLGYWIESGQLLASDAVAARLAVHLDHNRRRMKKLSGVTAHVVNCLDRAGVRATLLKGMHTAFSYFPEPGARSLSDIDVLVDPRDEERACEVLGQLDLEVGAFCPVPRQWAWQPRGERREPRSLRFVHADDPWAIDLQMSLNRRYSAGAPIVRLDVLSGERDLPSCAHHGAATLRQPLLLIQLACHAGCGLFSLTLQRQVEIALVIRRDLAAGALHWPQLVCAAERAGALASMYPALCMAERLVPGTVPAAILDRCRETTPPRVRRVIERLTPANAHRVTRCSIEERYMWVPWGVTMVRQLLDDVVPRNARDLSALWRIYRQRMWRVAHGTLTRQ